MRRLKGLRVSKRDVNPRDTTIVDLLEELPALLEKIETENSDVPNIGLEDYKKQIDIVEQFISKNKLKILPLNTCVRSFI